MNKTRIEWADYSWNPIKGLCPEACWYCYARAMYHRFKMDPEPWLDIAELNMMLKSRVTKARVFVCSTFELFHPISDTVAGRVLYGSNSSWRDYIFDVIKRRPDLTFIILTKRPERIDRAMPDNVWLGVSVRGVEDWHRVREVSKVQARVKFVSLEPFLGKTPSLGQQVPEFDWLIIGRLTGHGRKYDPEYVAVAWVVKQAYDLGIPIFMKDNLKGICGPLIQEYPR